MLSICFSSGVILNFVEIILTFCPCVWIIQDKALAALAIEDKKRQYAAAEKRLEDVLQAALLNEG